MSERPTGKIPGQPGIAFDRAGAGPLVVCLHGIGGNRLNWRDQLQAFAPQFTAVAWDARGYGDSDDYEGPLDYDDVASDLIRLLDYIGAGRAHIVGLSMGGRIAQHFYFAHPDRVATLTVADAHPGFAHLTPQQRNDFLQARQAPLLAGKEPVDIAPGLVDSLCAPDASSEARQRLFDSIAGLRKDMYLKSLEAAVMQQQIGDLTAIAVPAHFVVGEHDTLTTPELMREMAAQVDGARFTLIEGAGHLSNVEKPGAFNDAVLGFLQAHRDAADLPR